jgi:hypothetical protein
VNDILKRASKAFTKYDRLKVEMRALEHELTMLAREYDMASGCRGTRVESLRQRADERMGRKVA